MCYLLAGLLVMVFLIDDEMIWFFSWAGVCTLRDVVVVDSTGVHDSMIGRSYYVE